MFKRIVMFCLVMLITAAGLTFTTSLHAQDQITATTSGVTLNLRQLPDRRSESLAHLPPYTDLVVEARSEAGDWVLVNVPVMGVRGWVALGYITFDRAVRVMEELPVSNEQVVDPTVAGAEVTVMPVLDIIDYPAVYLDDQVWANVRNIWARGRQQGNDPWVMMKVGESNTAGNVYLCNFEWNAYSLGSHTDLQQVVDEFSRTGSFCRVNASAQNGFATVNVLDPQFAPSDICQPNENALQCEVRRSHASFAFIYIGLADTGILTPDQYEYNLTEIVTYLSQHGVIPIIGTWPTADALNGNNKPQIYNEVIRTVAHDQHIPMLDFRAALYNYDNHGTGPDGYHLSVRDTTRSELGGDELIYGRSYRELQSLQILHDLIAGLSG